MITGNFGKLMDFFCFLNVIILNIHSFCSVSQYSYKSYNKICTIDHQTNMNALFSVIFTLSLSSELRMILTISCFSYIPGSWDDNADSRECDAPNAISLLLIGPKSSGKSSLVNKISRVFEDNDVFLPARAQASCR